MNIKKTITNNLFIFFMLIICVNMGEGGRKYNAIDEPKFTPLEEGQGSFSSTIIDDSTETKVNDLSFFGSTSIDGIMKESDDSLNKIDIKNISIITIINEHYKSKRYPQKELCQISIKPKKGISLDDLLAPKKIVVCGIRENSGIQVSWFLSQVKQILIGEKSTSKKFTEYKEEKLNKKNNIQDTKIEIHQEQKTESKENSNYKKENNIQEKPIKDRRSLWDSFIIIIDSIIDFMKILLNKIVKLTKL